MDVYTFYDPFAVEPIAWYYWLAAALLLLIPLFWSAQRYTTAGAPDEDGLPGILFATPGIPLREKGKSQCSGARRQLPRSRSVKTEAIQGFRNAMQETQR